MKLCISSLSKVTSSLNICDCNAAAMICAHNHPSGRSEPSQADNTLTRKIRDALELVEVRLLDHFVIGHGEYTSYAERGLL